MTPYELSVLYKAYLDKMKANLNLNRDLVMNAIGYALSGSRKKIPPFIGNEENEKEGKINTVCTQEDILEFEEKLKDNKGLKDRIIDERKSIFGF